MEIWETPEVRALARAYEAWGLAPGDAESYAVSEAQGARVYPQLVFLWAAWGYVLNPNDPAWIDRLQAEAARHPGRATPAATALAELLEAGVDPRALGQVVREMQIDAVLGVLGLLDDARSVTFPEGAPTVEWGLFETDADGQPVEELQGFTELFFEADPGTGE
jgi:hypothetical protein